MKAQVLTSDALDQKELLQVLTAFEHCDFCKPKNRVGLGGKIAGKESTGWFMLDVLRHDSALWMPWAAEAAHSVAAHSFVTGLNHWQQGAQWEQKL
jgi:hypothetical protein